MSSPATTTTASLRAALLRTLKDYAGQRAALLARITDLRATLVRLTHNEPMLGERGLRANIKLEKGLRAERAEALEGSPSDEPLLDALADAIGEVSEWVDAMRELREVRAERTFLEEQGVILMDLCVDTIQYEREKEAAEANGGIFLHDYNTWSKKFPATGLKKPSVWRKEREEKRK